MRISIIGTGNMAHYIGERLLFNNLTFEEVVGRDINRLEAFVEKYGGQACRSIEELNARVDIIIIAVKDDEIENCAKQLNGLSAKMIVHCSGTQSVEALGESFEARAVVWPIFSLSKFRKSPYPKKVPLAVEWEGEETYKELLEELLETLSNEVYYISEKDRSLLHLAAVFSNNHIHHLMVLVEEFCEKHELPFDALKPIIYQTAAQVEKSPLRPLQTGPAIRHDEQTILQHETLLEDEAQLLALYRQFVKSIQS